MLQLGLGKSLLHHPVYLFNKRSGIYAKAGKTSCPLLPCHLISVGAFKLLKYLYSRDTELEVIPPSTEFTASSSKLSRGKVELMELKGKFSSKIILTLSPTETLHNVLNCIYENINLESKV